MKAMLMMTNGASRIKSLRTAARGDGACMANASETSVDAAQM